MQLFNMNSEHISSIIKDFFFACCISNLVCKIIFAFKKFFDISLDFFHQTFQRDTLLLDCTDFIGMHLGDVFELSLQRFLNSYSFWYRVIFPIDFVDTSFQHASYEEFPIT